MALDLVLRSFLSSPEFAQLQDKNWDAISRLVPGTTPKQCKKRYDELLQQSLSCGVSNRYVATSTTTSGTTLKVGRPDSGQGDLKLSRPGSGKPKGSKSEKETGSSKIDGKRPLSADHGPMMVIHVCDEAKNLKQDFQCPRDLLVTEMRYFAEYLSTDAQRWEEVDISVHCDVQIFDWLMNYVRRQTKDMNDPPKLEPSNVISILISSDFLKMDSLVQECIEFCHNNMTAIVSTPCNMNCINDKLTTRITDLFTHNEADEVRDRKDKFKSKLFSKKLEKLFDPNVTNPDSPGNAATLYRCGVCKNLLTTHLQGKVCCLPSRLTIDHRGKLAYSHVRDPAWDVNDFLLELKSQLKTWRDVYWRVWGLVNELGCSRCGDVFPCGQLGHCRYHPEPPTYDSTHSGLGMYLCCGQKMLRFDPTEPVTGCKVRDHVVNLTSPDRADSPDKFSESPSPANSAQHRVYEDLLAHRDAVCVPYQRLVSGTAEDMELNIFAKDEQLSMLKGDIGGKLKAVRSDSSISDDSSRTEIRPQPRLQALTVEREITFDDEFDDSDDEVGDEEDIRGHRFQRPKRSRVTVDPQAILLDAPDFSTIKHRKWDSSRSMRWNQDAQREEDQRRMKEIISYLTRLRLNTDKLDRLKQKEYAGGIYSKLEAQWKTVNAPMSKSGAAQTRNKPRLTSLVK